MQRNPRLAEIAVILTLGASRVGAQEQPRVALDLGYHPLKRRSRFSRSSSNATLLTRLVRRSLMSVI